MRMASNPTAEQCKMNISIIKRISYVFVTEVTTKQQLMSEIKGLLHNGNILPKV
ncbi:unnamed protein product (macronuclear) [Paramecium tetraurelia]|uniref:Uncharacterized protein n=1 Tax=Paramecium tetraurelia TaxID=5888 RepID=A0C6S6_PARTE|nr:uncharacterized protein GSPATT00035622001 [Paramecium tetraurelia]CAK66493.1 unnamed protein product [Paramecium tetraurelia]|eukprot:XP_001433890.1 hypothetical protein (macronuclear) [Paramecium tetraurelia strain d4-2]